MYKFEIYSKIGFNEQYRQIQEQFCFSTYKQKNDSDYCASFQREASAKRIQ